MGILRSLLWDVHTEFECWTLLIYSWQVNDNFCSVGVQDRSYVLYICRISAYHIAVIHSTRNKSC
jgi:hypothetical protein